MQRIFTLVFMHDLAILIGHRDSLIFLTILPSCSSPRILYGDVRCQWVRAVIWLILQAKAKDSIKSSYSEPFYEQGLTQKWVVLECLWGSWYVRNMQTMLSQKGKKWKVKLNTGLVFVKSNATWFLMYMNTHLTRHGTEDASSLIQNC